MNRTEASNISARVIEHLKSLESELKVTFSMGSGVFDSNSFTVKVIATSNAVDGSSQSKEEVDFVKNARLFGLSPEDLGKSFATGGKTFIVRGCKPRNTKYPIIVEGSKGGMYKMSAMQVRSGLTK